MKVVKVIGKYSAITVKYGVVIVQKVLEYVVKGLDIIIEKCSNVN